MRVDDGRTTSERECCVPPDGPARFRNLTLKVTKEGLARRVSATMVRLTVPMKPPIWKCNVTVGPLKADSDKAAVDNGTGRSDRALLRFMWHPMTA